MRGRPERLPRRRRPGARPLGSGERDSSGVRGKPRVDLRKSEPRFVPIVRCFAFFISDNVTFSYLSCFDQDLPGNKLIEFKFLLRDSSGKLHWQNGPNRIFQTGEIANTLVVYEDWGDVKNQRIVQEDVVASVVMEEAVVSDDSETENRNVTVLNDELEMDDSQEVRADEYPVAEENEKSAVATNASVQVDSLETNETNPQGPQEVFCLIKFIAPS